MNAEEITWEIHQISDPEPEKNRFRLVNIFKEYSDEEHLRTHCQNNNPCVPRPPLLISRCLHYVVSAQVLWWSVDSYHVPGLFISRRDVVDHISAL